MFIYADQYIFMFLMLMVICIEGLVLIDLFCQFIKNLKTLFAKADSKKDFKES